MKLICIGDSLTFGYGVRPSQRWTRLCAQETGWEIVNEGISGDTTGGMLVRLRAERYATWEWNYGKSPACTMLRRRRVDGCGLIEAYITVEHGLISVVAFKGDFFSAEEPEELAARFVGHTPDRAGYTAALDGVEAARYFAGLQTDELIDILCEG